LSNLIHNLGGEKKLARRTITPSSAIFRPIHGPSSAWCRHRGPVPRLTQVRAGSLVSNSTSNSTLGPGIIVAPDFDILKPTSRWAVSTRSRALISQRLCARALSIGRLKTCSSPFRFALDITDITILRDFGDCRASLRPGQPLYLSQRVLQQGGRSGVSAN